jgi:hypothetical protein
MARRDSILVSRTLYQIGVITMIAALMWVGIGIYLSIGKDFKLDVDKSVLEPLNPTLDQEVVKSLTGRLKIETDLTMIPESTISASENTVNIVDEAR